MPFPTKRFLKEFFKYNKVPNLLFLKQGGYPWEPDLIEWTHPLKAEASVLVVAGEDKIKR